MSQDAKDIVCPNCGATVAIVPTDRQIETPLVCGHCSTVLHRAGPGERAVDAMKDAVGGAIDKIEDRISRKRD